VSELVIGLTIVAVGTSLSEMATSVLATLRGQRDIAIGNVVGSNIFNILSVLGISAAVAPAGINVAPAALNFDIPVMIAVSAVCLPVFFSGLITRREGFLFVLSYAAYATYLVLDSQQHFLRDEFTQVMVYGVLPGSFLLLALGFIDALRKRRAEARGERFDG
jgi:cation:H+ antiporter